jgi:hypothetical protein
VHRDCGENDVERTESIRQFMGYGMSPTYDLLPFATLCAFEQLCPLWFYVQIEIIGRCVVKAAMDNLQLSSDLPHVLAL